MKNARSRRTKKPRSRQADTLEKINNILHAIDEKQSVQVRGLAPVAPDIPRVHLKNHKVYTFERAAGVGTISSSTTIQVFSAVAFSLSSLTQSTEFTLLFDQWRIAQVTLIATPTTGNLHASLYSVLDYDDSNIPTNLTDLYQYNTLMQTQSNQPHVRTLAPQYAIDSYQGILTTGFSSAKNWVDCSTPGVTWYGVKYGIPVSTTVDTWEIVAYYTIQFREVR